MFQPKSFFEAGLKILGILTMIWSLTHIAPVISQFFTIFNQPDFMSDNNLSYYRFSLIFQVLYPLILFIIGGYLLKSGKVVIDLAFRNLNTENETDKDRVDLLFILFMKLAGLALIIYALPKTFQIISNIMFTSSVYGMDTSDQTQFIIENFVTTGVSLLFGFYLLRSGKIFYKLGFTKNKDTE